jgi:hypothetical protein
MEGFLTREQIEVLAELRKVARILDRAHARRDALIVKACNMDIKQTAVGHAANMSGSRISQINMKPYKLGDISAGRWSRNGSQPS